MRKFLKTIGILLLLGVILGGFFGYSYYQKIFAPNVPDSLTDPYVYIPSNSSFEDVADMLENQGFIKDRSSFEWVAQQMKYVKNPMRSGRYKIEGGMSNRSLIAVLRGGRQAPVDLVIHNKRTLPQVAGLLGSTFEADSLTFLATLTDENFLAKYGYTLETAMSVIIPNTYEMYWITSPETFFERMVKEHNTFWNEDRIAKAKRLNMTKEAVYTLASIVETETQYKPERRRVAGVYLNRIKIGMPLQADPTLVFAWGDFSIKRVYNYHKEIDSPYNTYKNKGLPPGPIYMSSISSIDAVLNAETHEFLYFCAKPDNSGSHAFAKTLDGHNVNARRYQNWLNQQNIR